MIDLKWTVPVQGFMWIERPGIRPGGRGKLVTTLGRWLIPCDSVSPPDGRSYNTANCPALFRSFAELATTEEAVASFANEYGFLTDGQARVLRAIDCTPRGESLDLWANEIRDMRHVLRWAERARVRDHRWLAQFLTIQRGSDGEELLHKFHDSKSFGELLIASNNRNPAVLEHFRAGRITQTAQETLVTLLNERLQVCRVQIQLRSRLGISVDSGRPWSEQSFVPEDLLSALWAQVAQAVHGAKEYRQCEHCSEWFELTEQRRGDAKFCRDACRSRAYRARKMKAIHLKQQGVTERDIAKQLQTDVNTVKSWIAGVAKPRKGKTETNEGTCQKARE